MRSYIQKNDSISYTDNYSTPKEIYNDYVTLKKYLDPCPLYEKDFDVKNEIAPSNWFLDGKEDVRSSYFLEIVAT